MTYLYNQNLFIWYFLYQFISYVPVICWNVQVSHFVAFLKLLLVLLFSEWNFVLLWRAINIVFQCRIGKCEHFMKESDAGTSCSTWPTYDDAPFRGGTVLRRRLQAQQGFLCYTHQVWSNETEILCQHFC